MVKIKKIEAMKETGKITPMSAILQHMPSFHLPLPSSYRQEPDNGYDSDLIVVLCQDLVQVKMRNFSPF